MVSTLFERLVHDDGFPPLAIRAFWSGLWETARGEISRADFDRLFDVTDSADQGQVTAWVNKINSAAPIDPIRFIQILELAEIRNKSEPGIPPGQRTPYYTKAKLRSSLMAL